MKGNNIFYLLYPYLDRTHNQRLSFEKKFNVQWQNKPAQISNQPYGHLNMWTLGYYAVYEMAVEEEK